MKKIFIILILIVTMLSGSVAFGEVNVSGADLNASEQSREFLDAIGCGSLSLLEGDETKITYREFVSYLVIALGLAPAYENLEEISKPQLNELENMAKSFGLISGAYSSDDVIQKYDAVKICLKAANYLEYTILADSGSLALNVRANKLGLFENIGTENGELTLGQALILIRNTLEADSLHYVWSSDDIRIKTEEATVMEDYRGIYKSEGIITANRHTSLYDENGGTGSNAVLVDGKRYETSFETDGLLGMNADIYYELEGGNKPVILYARANESNTVVTLSSEDVEAIDGTKLSYLNESGALKHHTLDKSFFFIHNGVAYNDYTDSDFRQPSGAITLIDNNSDGKYEVVSVRSDEFMMADYVDAIDEFIIQNGASPLDLSKSDTVYNCYRLDRYNQFYRTELEDFPGGVPVRINRSKNGSIINIYETDYVKGVVRGIGDNTVTVNSSEYPTVTGFNDSCGIDMNYQGIFAFNPDGKIAAFFESDVQSDYAYAYLIAVKKDSDKLSDTVHIKLFSEIGEIETHQLERVVIDGIKTDSEDIEAKLLASNGEAEQIIRCKKNSDGKITAIDTARVWNASETAIDGYPKASDMTDSLYLCIDGEYNYKNDYNVNCFADNNMGFNAGGSSVVFIVGNDKSEEDEHRFKMGTSYLDNGTKYSVKAYDIDEGGTAGAILIYLNNITEQVNVSVQSSLITDVHEAILSDGSQGYKVMYWSAGRYYTAYTDDINIKTSGRLDAGDVVRMVLDGDGTIKQISVDYDYSKKGPDGSATSYFSSEMAYLSYSTVSLYSHKNNYLLVSNTSNGAGGYLYGFANLKNYCMNNAKIVIFDAETGIARSATLNELKSYVTYGSEADELLVRKCYYAPQLVIAYR